jgi:hypothetical protein
MQIYSGAKSILLKLCPILNSSGFYSGNISTTVQDIKVHANQSKFYFEKMEYDF